MMLQTMKKHWNKQKKWLEINEMVPMKSGRLQWWPNKILPSLIFTGLYMVILGQTGETLSKHESIQKPAIFISPQWPFAVKNRHCQFSFGQHCIFVKKYILFVCMNQGMEGSRSNFLTFR